MIDYITAIIPVDLPAPIFGGRFISTVLEADGEVHENTTLKRLKLEGSHSSAIHVRSIDCKTIEVKGNLSKWLEGHNLYGTDDLPQLLKRAVGVIFDRYFPQYPAPSAADIDRAQLSRVDVTYMYQLASADDVSAWIDAASKRATIDYRGRGKLHEKGDTLTWGIERGKRHSSWALVVYHKGKETAKHPLPEAMQLPEVLEWVSRCIRFELRLLGQELKRITPGKWKGAPLTAESKSLRYVRNWHPNAARMCFMAKTGRLFVGDTTVEVEEMLDVKPRVRSEYHAWLSGLDPRNGRSLATWKRLRREIRDAYGVDISLNPPRPGDDSALLDLRGVPAPSPDPDNVRRLPVKRVLRLEPLPDRPSWAAMVEARLAA